MAIKQHIEKFHPFKATVHGLRPSRPISNSSHPRSLKFSPLFHLSPTDVEEKIRCQTRKTLTKLNVRNFVGSEAKEVRERDFEKEGGKAIECFEDLNDPGTRL